MIQLASRCRDAQQIKDGRQQINLRTNGVIEVIPRMVWIHDDQGDVGQFGRHGPAMPDGAAVFPEHFPVVIRDDHQGFVQQAGMFNSSTMDAITQSIYRTSF